MRWIMSFVRIYFSARPFSQSSNSYPISLINNFAYSPNTALLANIIIRIRVELKFSHGVLFMDGCVPYFYYIPVYYFEGTCYAINLIARAPVCRTADGRVSEYFYIFAINSFQYYFSSKPKVWQSFKLLSNLFCINWMRTWAEDSFIAVILWLIRQKFH